MLKARREGGQALGKEFSADSGKKKVSRAYQDPYFGTKEGKHGLAICAWC